MVLQRQQQPQRQQRPLPQEVKVRIPHPQQTSQQNLHHPLVPRQVVVRLHRLPLRVHLVLAVVHLVVTTVEGIKDLVKSPKLS